MIARKAERLLDEPRTRNDPATAAPRCAIGLTARDHSPASTTCRLAIMVPPSTTTRRTTSHMTRHMVASLPQSNDERRDRAPIEAHAAVRLARAVAAVVTSSHDLRTVKDWAQLVCASTGALRTWCDTAGVSARRSLIFGRIVRVISLRREFPGRPEHLFDVADTRTLAGLYKVCGMRLGERFPANVDEFLARQTVMCEADLVAALRTAIREAESDARKRRHK
jgi:hypothetical protein